MTTLPATPPPPAETIPDAIENRISGTTSQLSPDPSRLAPVCAVPEDRPPTLAGPSASELIPWSEAP